MKSITLIVLLLILVNFTCLGQVNGFDYSPNHLKGYKKIVSTSTLRSTPTDSLKLKTVYNIDNSGRITIIESFENGEKVHFGSHTYNSKGQLTAIKNHNQVYSYDEKVKDHVPAVSEDIYFLTLMEYNNNQLSKESEYTYYKGTGSLDAIHQYEYDKQGRKIKETHTDLYEGIAVAFASNSVVIDSIYNKGEAVRTISTYSYSKNLVKSTDIDENGEKSRYSYITLNAKGKPVSIKYTDMDGAEIESIYYEYNSDGYLTRRKRKVVDPSKLKGDILAEDDFRIEYGKNKLPAKVITYHKGQIVSKNLLDYQ
ncbi:hypothetical protein ABID22_001967 [Pontibacter aydingkolensis]|uniref:YD repeat-containing protein n=1 Tax=Pontibacter aydingkolensis TaxID=1911536 RepID=A0ABS7CUQ3_9BACT|nr:hypothetical protein [Pontibacter aydingkolensis]MBW7467584.1 hypothetical protein [Pontibacter aydingkolensis]